MPDENDIVYNSYGIDLIPWLLSLGRGIQDFLGLGESQTLGGGPAFQSFFETVGFWWNIYSFFALALSLVFLAGFIYAKIRAEELKEVMLEQLRETEKAWQHTYGNASSKNSRWSEIEQHVTTENPSDWRLAIIEADILLDQSLEGQGYIGPTVADKLKSASASGMTSLQDAWDAHKVRNQIAHAGPDFVLTKRMAQNALTQYQHVLRELGVL